MMTPGSFLARARRAVVAAALVTAAGWGAGPGIVQPSPVAAQHEASVAVSWGRPVLQDDFDGSALNTGRWRIYDDPSGQHPRRADRVSVGGGVLRLTGTGDASGGIASTLNQQYGRWEARMRIERGAGYSGVVLLWPQSENWPHDGEIDVVEVNKGARTSATSTVHRGADNRMTVGTVSADFTTWRTVAVEWLPDRVTFYVDGVAHFTVNRPAGSGFDFVPAESPMHLALQNDKGCDEFIQCPDGQTPASVTMEVDWVKVFRRPG